MNLAIDRWSGAEGIGKLNLFSVVSPMQRLGSPFARSKEETQKLPGFRPDMNANRAEARKLLAEAGQPNLKGVFTNRPQYTALGVYLIDQWRQIGAAITQEQPDNAAYANARRSGGFDMIGDTFPDYIDEPTIQFANVTSFDVNPSNTSRAIDRTLDELFEKQLRATDLNARKQLVWQLEDRMLSQAYMTPLYWAKRIMVVANEVRGFNMSPSALIGQDLSEIWIAK
jgi:peptide/nickel transport system substrate-binding protein